MGMPQKEWEYFSCKLDKEVAESLNRFCKDTGLSKTKAVEKALQQYIETYYKEGDTK